MYAANGLMRAGAWSAAWNEMEMVDVEVSVWLPEDVKREVDGRCLELGIGYQMEAEEEEAEHVHDHMEAETRRTEVYGNSGHDTQEKIDGFFESHHLEEDGRRGNYASRHRPQHDVPVPTLELKQLFINYVKALAHDNRNVAIAILSVAVLFFTLSTSASTSQSVDRHTVPLSGLVPSSQKISQCTMSSMSSVSAAPELPSTGSAVTSKDTAAVLQHEKPMTPASPAQTDVQAITTDGKQDAIHEVELEVENSSTAEIC